MERYTKDLISGLEELIDDKPLFKELFEQLMLDYKGNDFTKASGYIERIDLGENFVRIIEPEVEILDFFYTKNFRLHSILRAQISAELGELKEIAWMEKTD